MTSAEVVITGDSPDVSLTVPPPRWGATGLLYRPKVLTIDRNGDAVNLLGDVVRPTSPGTFIGTLRGILKGGPAATQSLSRRGESADTTGKFGIPMRCNPRVEENDRIVIGKVTYKVVSRPDWGYRNTITGTRPSMDWVQVAATTDE